MFHLGLEALYLELVTLHLLRRHLLALQEVLHLELVTLHLLRQRLLARRVTRHQRLERRHLESKQRHLGLKQRLLEPKQRHLGLGACLLRPRRLLFRPSGHLLQPIFLPAAMRLLHWDDLNPHSIPPGQPYRWGDPNLFFGPDGKGYAREPGDPGFIPYQAPSPVQRSRNTTRKMKHNAYYPTSAAKQILWLTNFYLKLIGHAATLGVGTTACAAAVADARWIIYILGSWQPALKPWSKSCTDAVKEAQTGTSGVLMVLPLFTPPPLPVADAPNNLPAVVPVITGALDRIFSLVQVIQEAPGYNDTLGTDLGIIGTEATAPDLHLVQPEITVELRGQHVFIGWGWGGFSEHLDLCQIQVDRGTGQGWVDLAYDTTPGYLDTAAHPAVLTKWKYRAIYRVDDSQTGLWSAEVSITVGG